MYERKKMNGAASDEENIKGRITNTKNCLRPCRNLLKASAIAYPATRSYSSTHTLPRRVPPSPLVFAQPAVRARESPHPYRSAKEEAIAANDILQPASSKCHPIPIQKHGRPIPDEHSVDANATRRHRPFQAKVDFRSGRQESGKTTAKFQIDCGTKQHCLYRVSFQETKGSYVFV